MRRDQAIFRTQKQKRFHGRHRCGHAHRDQVAHSGGGRTGGEGSGGDLGELLRCCPVKSAVKVEEREDKTREKKGKEDRKNMKFGGREN